MVLCNLPKVKTRVRFSYLAQRKSPFGRFFGRMINMDIKIIFSAIAIIIGFSATFPYIKDIFSFKTKPHVYTWLIWSLTTGTAALAAYYGGGGVGSINLILMFFVTFGIFLISIKYGTKNITISDTIILITALLAILIWWQLQQPLISVLMVSAIDVIGYFPSFRKSWYEPWSETIISWLGFALANIFAILALSEYNFLTVTYLFSIMSANATLFLICLMRRLVIARPI